MATQKITITIPDNIYHSVERSASDLGMGIEEFVLYSAREFSKVPNAETIKAIEETFRKT